MVSNTPQNYVVEITEQNINTVLQQSVNVPVLLDFWADWCQPCKTLAPLLEKLVKEYQGRFILAKVNTDEQPRLAQQLGVRSLPTLKLVVQGQLADELTGVQPESELRKFLEPHVGPAQPQVDEDPFLAQIERARRLGAWQQAMDALQAAIQEHPKRQEYRAAYVELLLDTEQFVAAEAAIEEMDAGPDKTRVSANLFLIQELAGAPALDTLLQQVQEQPENAELRYQLALRMLLQGNAEAAFDALLLVMQTQPDWRAGAPRKALLAGFDRLPKDDPLLSRYRRKMFALLH
jgi:putative thioredoxin